MFEFFERKDILYFNLKLKKFQLPDEWELAFTGSLKRSAHIFHLKVITELECKVHLHFSITMVKFFFFFFFFFYTC
jgi:hypothetical protein